MTALDDLMDEAHDLEACGCPDCGRAGLQWGPSPTGEAWWVSFVFEVDGKTRRVEQDGGSLELAALGLLVGEFDRVEAEA